MNANLKALISLLESNKDAGKIKPHRALLMKMVIRDISTFCRGRILAPFQIENSHLFSQ